MSQYYAGLIIADIKIQTNSAITYLTTLSEEIIPLNDKDTFFIVFLVFPGYLMLQL